MKRRSGLLRGMLAAALLAAAGCGITGNDVYLYHDSRTYAELAGRHPQRTVPSQSDIVTVRNRHGEIKVSLVGANVTSYIPSGGEEVFFSIKNPDFSSNEFQHSGVPVVWPWFNKSGAAGCAEHAFVRQMRWKVLENAAGRNVSRLVLGLESDRETRRMWPYEFKLVYTIELGESLNVSLLTENTDCIPFSIGEGFHAYFSVSDVNKVVLRGLDGVRSDSFLGGMADQLFRGDLKLRAGEERSFFPGDGEYVLFDEGKGRAIAMAAQGHSRLTLWSIRPECSSGQFAEGDWRRFLCIEPSTVTHDTHIRVLPGRKHELRMNVKVVPLVKTVPLW